MGKDTEVEYIVFSCPKCRKRRRTFSSNFDKRVQCSCGHLFDIGAGLDIVFENGPLPTSVHIQESREVCAAPGEIPPSKRKVSVAPLSMPIQLEEKKITDSHPSERKEFDWPAPKRGSDFIGVLLFDFLLTLALFFAVQKFTKKAEDGFFVAIIMLSWLILPTLIAYLAEEKTGHVWIWFFLALIIGVFPSLVDLLNWSWTDQKKSAVCYYGPLLQIIAIFILLSLPKPKPNS